MKPWWQHWSKHLTPNECALIQAHASRIAPKEATVGHGGKEYIVNSELRVSEVRWLDRRDHTLRWLYDRITLAVLRSNINAGWDYDVNDFNEVQHTTYPENVKGHYGWHEDLSWMAPSETQRKLSVVIQLCDPSTYEGGKLEFAHDGFGDKEFSNQGDLVVFPSFLRHRVTDVTKGTRNSLVTWVNGPAFR